MPADTMPDVSQLPPPQAAALRTLFEWGYPLGDSSSVRDVEIEIVREFGVEVLRQLRAGQPPDCLSSTEPHD